MKECTIHTIDVGSLLFVFLETFKEGEEVHSLLAISRSLSTCLTLRQTRPNQPFDCPNRIHILLKCL